MTDEEIDNLYNSTALIKDFSLNMVGREDTDIAKQQAEVDQQTWYQTLGIATDDKTETLWGGIKDSFTSGGNWAYSVFDRIDREANNVPDPSFDPAAYLQQNKKSIPDLYERSIMEASSRGAADATVAKIRSDQQAQTRLARLGITGQFVTAGIAGILDADLPLTMAMGGMNIGGKLGLTSTKIGARMAGGMEGALSAGLVGTIGETASPTGDVNSIGVAVLANAGFGMLGRNAEPDLHAMRGNETIEKMKTELDTHIKEGSPRQADNLDAEPLTDAPFYKPPLTDEELAELGSPKPKAEGEEPAKREPQAFEVEDKPETLDVGEEWQVGTRSPDAGSIGARQLGQDKGRFTMDPESVTNVQTAQTYIKQNNLARAAEGDYAEGLNSPNPLVRNTARAAQRLTDAMQSIGLGSDFQRWVKTGTASGLMLAHKLFEDPSGLLRSNRSASAIMDMYEKKLLAAWSPVYKEASDDYLKSKGLGTVKREFDYDLREQFHKEVYAEMEARRLQEDPAGRAVDPHVKRMADSMDKWSKLDVETGKGRANEHSMDSYKDLDAYSGYAPRKWGVSQIAGLIREGKYKDKDIELALSEMYQRTGDFMDKKTSDKIAGSIMTRIKAGDRGADVNLWSLLQGDGQDAFIQAMKNAGLSARETENLLDKLKGDRAERGKAGHTKGRLDADVRFVASNGVKIMDLLDTDLDKLLTRRSRHTAGQAALARQGFTNPEIMRNWKNTILQEQQYNGQNKPTGTTTMDKVGDFIDRDKHLKPEEIDQLFGYFSGQVANGGDAMYSRMRAATRLSLLSQLGVTSLAEFGAVAAGLGAREFFTRLPQEVKAMFHTKDSPLMQELKTLGIYQPEEMLYSHRYAASMDKTVHAATELEQFIDRTLAVGSKVQGIISGFNKVRELNQRLALAVGTDKLIKHMQGKSAISDARLQDMGFTGPDAHLYARVRDKYLKTNVIEMDADGNLVKLNLDKWSADDAEGFTLVMNRVVDQYVQRARIGESNILFHKDGLASMFFQLKSFPMIAIQKQMARNAYVADPEALAQFYWGLAAGSTAYTAKQIINGRSENLDPVSIAKGGFGLSNMAGFLPMLYDPIMGVLGMDSMKFNSYSYGVDNNVISSPAALPTMNKILSIPGAVKNLATFQGLDGGDVQALRAIPVFGNMYGMVHVLNALRADRE